MIVTLFCTLCHNILHLDFQAGDNFRDAVMKTGWRVETFFLPDDSVICRDFCPEHAALPGSGSIDSSIHTSALAGGAQMALLRDGYYNHFARGADPRGPTSPCRHVRNPQTK